MSQQVKAFGLLAVVISVSGVAFQLFTANTAGRLNSLFQLGSSSIQALGGLFVALAIIFLYQAFRV